MAFLCRLQCLEFSCGTARIEKLLLKMAVALEGAGWLVILVIVFEEIVSFFKTMRSIPDHILEGCGDFMVMHPSRKLTNKSDQCGGSGRGRCFSRLTNSRTASNAFE
eukprot:Skav226326  [mRNA]  locus=scaffold3301:675650:679651:- [translate_table: standard]